MPPINHLAYLLEDTKTAIESLQLASNLVARQWYFATDENRAYYAATNSVLIGPLDEAGMPTFTDTPSITHTDNGGGDFEFDVKIDSASNNILGMTANGLIVPDISIASGSQAFLDYNTSTRELSVKQLLITDVTVDTVQVDFAAWIAANYTGLEKQEGDLVILTAPTNKESWIHNGGTAGTIADWTNISANIDDAYIRALLSGGDGISYNSTTGEISVDISSDADNVLGLGSDDGLFLDSAIYTISNGSVQQTVRFGNQLRIEPFDLINVTTAQASGGSIKRFDLSWNTAGATPGQVVTWDGTNVVFDDPAGGTNIEHWEEDYHDTGVNETRPVSSWGAKGAESTIDIAFLTKGNASISAHVPDGTATGGNKRGLNAIDWQTDRNAADQVASGPGSVIIGGRYNLASGTRSVVLGGTSNEATAANAIAGGNRSKAIHIGSLVLSDNAASSNDIASTQASEAIFAYENRIWLRTDLAQVSGELQVDTVNQDNGLEEILAIDNNGVVHRRAIGTFPGASGSSNIYNTSGALDGNRNLDLAGFTLTFRDSSDNNIVRFSESGSTIRAMAGDIEVDTAGSGLIIKSPNGTRHRITVADAGFIRTEQL